jgi:cyanate permease
MMGLATLLIIPALGDTGVERRARLACAAHVVATVLAGIVYFSPTYSYTLLMVGFPWAITAPLFMLVLGIALRDRDGRSAA